MSEEATTKPLQNDIKHVVGNAVFAVESNIECLERRIQRSMIEGGDQAECFEILAEMVTALEKIKAFITEEK
jgi:hypothetical protein